MRPALVMCKARLVAQHEGLRHGTVKQAQRDAAVGGMGNRSLSLDDDPVVVTRRFEYERFGDTRDEVGRDGIDRDTGAANIDTALAGSDETCVDASSSGSF